MMAHITYLSDESMRLKFDRARREPDAPMTMESDFEVEHYLDHQARIFLARFEPHTYLYLSRVMDYFEPFAEHDGTPVDALPADLLRQRLALRHRALGAHRGELAARGADVRHHEVRSPWGHDSFLMDVPEYHALVREFLG